MFRDFIADESAATSIEYGLIATIISIGILVSIQTFAGSLSDLWLYTSSAVTTNID
ncbi:MAG: Flp family type IVb pilin [Proteobacteria bacterium]|nr:Flp family type IVb pilin [Pseudomonadota bacterium]MCP4917907.1 Flp family type IVb pilin [Pseudomonadota bacterium]